jgi:hypothetical protein
MTSSNHFVIIIDIYQITFIPSGKPGSAQLPSFPFWLKAFKFEAILMIFD